LSIQLSDRIQRIKPSATLAVSAKTVALKAKGIDIISLGVGEPDFDTPALIKKAAIAAIHAGFTKYTAVEGILELRKAIVAKFAKDNQLQYEPNQILVSCGGKQSFFNLAQALLNAGDEVIIPAPYWVSYPDMVLLADAKPVIVFAGIEQHFKITPAQLEAAITPKTKLFVINSPSNPSGMAYTHDELQALGKVLIKYPHVFIATDDMYEKIYWREESFFNILNGCPELKDRTIVLHGVSKTYAMTGWRIGFAAGPKVLIEAMASIQSQSTSNPCSISQMAAKAALEGDEGSITTMVQAYRERHDFLVPALNAIEGIECLRGDGTFYAFPKVQGLIEHLKLANDIAFAEYLLEKARIAVVPGSAFGAEGYMRLSFATSLDNLQEAMARLRQALGVDPLP
jgi:aspartate aminotransferase